MDRAPSPPPAYGRRGGWGPRRPGDHPPGPGDFTCPGGQTLVPADVTHTGVSLGDTTDGVAAAIPCTFSKVFAAFRK